MQESKLINVDHGDRDSLGLFQQRPSQGWGTAEQILRPVYSTSAFYRALVRVPGWRTMSITEAAQAVQRSAFPNAYAAHEEDAIALASALRGLTAAAFTCTVHSTAPGHSNDSMLLAIADDLTTGFGKKVTVNRQGDSLVVHTVGGVTRRRAWAVASYLVARARILDVATVSVADKVWDRTSGTWRQGSAQGLGIVTASPV